jgi:hypothetical protein
MYLFCKDELNGFTCIYNLPYRESDDLGKFQVLVAFFNQLRVFCSSWCDDRMKWRDVGPQQHKLCTKRIEL